MADENGNDPPELRESVPLDWHPTSLATAEGPLAKALSPDEFDRDHTLAPARSALSKVYDLGVAVTDAEDALHVDATRTETAKRVDRAAVRAKAMDKAARSLDHAVEALAGVRKENRKLLTCAVEHIAPADRRDPVASEIRSFIRSKDAEGASVVTAAINAGDETTIKAVLSAPAYLSGLTPEVHAALRGMPEAKLAPRATARVKAATAAIEHLQGVGSSAFRRWTLAEDTDRAASEAKLAKEASDAVTRVLN